MPTILSNDNYITTIHVITHGIVRNLLKTTYYLRVPADPYRKDKLGRTIPIPPNEDVSLDYRDWKLVEYDLITKDWLKILKIIKYPAHSCSGNFTVINNYTELPPVPVPPGTVVWVQYGYYQGFFYWDEARNDWLSENTTTVEWSSNTNVNTHTVNLVSNADGTHSDNDAEIPVAMTIVTMAGSQVNPILAGNGTRFAVNLFNLATSVQSPEWGFIDLTTIGERGVSDPNLNIRVDPTTVLSATRIKLSGAETITRPAFTLWYRQRLTP